MRSFYIAIAFFLVVILSFYLNACTTKKGQPLTSEEKAKFKRVEALASAYIDQGLALSKKKKHDKAIEKFSRVIEVAPGSPEAAAAHHYRGVISYGRGQYSEAIKDFSEVIEIDDYSKFKRALKEAKGVEYYMRGRIHYEVGQYDDAVSDFNKALKLTPLQAAVYKYRGSAYEELEEYRSAKKDFITAIVIAPKSDIGRGAYKDLKNLAVELGNETRSLEEGGR